MPWWRDRTLLIALAVGLLLRVVPLLLWMDQPCTNDECGYLHLAHDMAEGQGMTRWSRGWVWAPGYVAFLALHEVLLGFADFGLASQVVLSLATPVLGYQLARKHLGLRAAHVAAWLLCVSPSLVFFATKAWGETLYTLWLVGVLWGLDRARDGRLRDAIVPAIFLALCVLFRGIGQYLLPLAALGLVWGRPPQALRKLAVMAATTAVLVAPYSLYASSKFGGFVLSEVTLGFNLWMGANDFPQPNFDHGVGYDRDTFTELSDELGRPTCARKDRSVVEWDRCEKANGVAWIRDNPGEYARRIPLRVAHMFNPNSFLIRQARIGRMPGLPTPLADGLGVLVILFSWLAIWGGTVAAFARLRGWLLVTSLAIVLYHLGAHALFIGMSRYRVPLDAIWLVWAAVLVAEPRATWASLQGWRRVACFITLALAIPLSLWFTVKGFM